MTPLVNHLFRAEFAVKYIKVLWKHANPDDPIWLYSELIDDLWKIRKVEVLADGAKGHADQAEEAGGTRLGR